LFLLSPSLVAQGTSLIENTEGKFALACKETGWVPRQLGWQGLDHQGKTTFPVAKQQNILIDHVELQTCKHG
jgi:hypothetical protein